MSSEFPEKDYIKNMADEHWEYVQSICELMYKTAMVHGYGHGYEDCEKKYKEMKDESIRKEDSKV